MGCQGWINYTAHSHSTKSSAICSDNYELLCMDVHHIHFTPPRSWGCARRLQGNLTNPGSSRPPRGANWRVTPQINLRWKLLEGHYVVYNIGSGDTHVLDPIAALVFRQLCRYSLEIAELAELVGALLELEVTDELRGNVEETLVQLGQLGLIEFVCDV